MDFQFGVSFLSVLRASDEIREFCTVKKYGSRFKLVHHKYPVRRAGLDRPKSEADNLNPPQDGGPVRYESSLSRTRSAVFELAACNQWEWFCTFTLADDRGFDRFDLEGWRKDFSQWIRNQRRLHRCELDYLIVPEKHENGAWHMHGLVKGLPLQSLRRFGPDEYLPVRLLRRIRAGDALYEWPAYRKKYGYTVIEPIRDIDRCASYIAKYVSKAFAEPTLVGNQHMYFASQGLQRAELVQRGILTSSVGVEWDFSNEYCDIKWSNTNDWELEPV